MEAKFTLLIAVTVELIIIRGSTQTATGTIKEHILKRNQRTVGMNPELHQAYLDLLQQIAPTTPVTPSGWEELAPSVPEGNDVNCYMEVVTLERRGGRCIRFGSPTGLAVCQSGLHYDVQDQCETIILHRQLSK